jgi:addiction module HigA family antidote
MGEASHVDDKTQAGDDWRNSGRGIHEADRLTQGALAEAMGVQRKHVNELCNDRRNVTAATALILARVFGNSPDFWLNVQRRSDLWEAMHSPRERKRIERARPLTKAA